MRIKGQVLREVHGEKDGAILALRKLAEVAEQRAQEESIKGRYGRAEQKYHLAALFLRHAMDRWPPMETLREIKEAQDAALRWEYNSAVLKGIFRT